MTLVWVALHTLVIYLFLIVALATVGRQQISQLTVLDYLIIALLGSAVETGLYLGGGSFLAGLVSAATLLLANRGLGVVVERSPAIRRFIVGVPIVLVHNGKIIPANLRRARLTKKDLFAAIRLRGYDDLRSIRFAVTEPSGEIGVVPRDDRAEDSGGDT